MLQHRTYTEEHRQRLRENAAKARAAKAARREQHLKEEHTERQLRKRIARAKLASDMRRHREWSSKR